MDGRVDKAVAFSKMGINLLNSEVSVNVSYDIKLIQYTHYAKYKFLYQLSKEMHG